MGGQEQAVAGAAAEGEVGALLGQADVADGVASGALAQSGEAAGLVPVPECPHG